MDYTERHLEALRSALAHGEQTVNFDDTTIEYRSVEDLRRAISDVLHALMAQADVAGLGPHMSRRIGAKSGTGH